MKKLLLCFYPIFLLSFAARAQMVTAPANPYHLGVLPAFSQTGRITDRVDYNLFLSSTFNLADQADNGIKKQGKDLQFYIQPSLIYKYSANLNIAASYVYQRNNPLALNYTNENRLWQQVIYAFTFYDTRVSNRIRFEERFIRNRITNKAPLTTRLRYQLAFTKPLSGKTLDPKEYYVSAYNEFYFSTSKTRLKLYSENWAYLGLGYQTTNVGRLEAGLLYQRSIISKTPVMARSLTLLQVAWLTNFQFSKKAK